MTTKKTTARTDKPPTTARQDGWANLLTGVGIKGKDRRLEVGYKPSARLSDSLLRAMYRGDGFARKVVDVPTKELLRAGFTVTADPDGLINARFEETGIDRSIADLLRWSRLFGGALGVLGLKDGGKLPEPLNEARLQSVEFMHVFDRYRVQWTSGDLYTDPNNAKFGRPQWYTVQPINGGQFRVHESRTVRLDGLPVPEQDRVENQGWGDSTLQAAYDQLRQFAAVYGGAELIVEDFVQAVLSIKNLQDMLASGNEKLVQTRLDMMDLARHVLHIKLLDADGETYHKESSSVAGLPDLIDRFAYALAGVVNIPVTKLLGRAPAGMNSTGESDLRNWYDDLSADQESILSPLFERLCYLVFISKNGGFKGREPEAWELVWNPLYQLTEKEEAEVYKTTADADAAYISAGVLDPGDVHDQRFAGSGFGGIIADAPAPGAPPTSPFTDDQ